MKKKILTILFLFAYLFSFSQTDNRAPFYRVWGPTIINSEGYAGVGDTAHFSLQLPAGKAMLIAKGDTADIPATPGAFIYQESNKQVYFSDGLHWYVFSSVANTSNLLFDSTMNVRKTDTNYIVGAAQNLTQVTSNGNITDTSIRFNNVSNSLPFLYFNNQPLAINDSVGYSLALGTGAGADNIYGNNGFTGNPGVRNTAIGFYANNSVTTGHANTSVGAIANSHNRYGKDNTSIGENSGGLQGLFNRTPTDSAANGNVAVGSEANYQNSIGDNNTVVGFAAMEYDNNGNEGGMSNPQSTVALGWFTMGHSTDPFQVTALGAKAGQNAHTCTQCLFAGFAAGWQNNNTIGFNTYVGGSSGYNDSLGHNNIFIGYANGPTNTLAATSNSTILGNQIFTTLSNIAIVGRSDQNVLIGNKQSNTITSSTGDKLQVYGNTYISDSLKLPILSNTDAAKFLTTDATGKVVLAVAGGGGASGIGQVIAQNGLSNINDSTVQLGGTYNSDINITNTASTPSLFRIFSEGIPDTTYQLSELHIQGTSFWMRNNSGTAGTKTMAQYLDLTNGIMLSTNSTNLGTGAGGMQINEDTNQLIIRTTSNRNPTTDTLLRITNAGLVGINNNKLTIDNDGNTTVSGNLTVNQNVTIDGNTKMKQEVYGSITSVSANYTVGTSEYIIMCVGGGSFTITLPNGGISNRILIIKNAGGGTITLTNMFSGDPTTIPADAAFQLVFNGEWFKIN